MPRETAAMKARRLLVQGRVRAIEINEEDGIVVCEVRSDSSRTYSVSFDTSDGWVCDCAAYVRRCAHVQAVQLITVMEPRS